MIMDVPDETGRAAVLAARISKTLTIQAPAISQISGLPLPRVRFRLLTPAGWRSAARDYVDRALDRPFIESPATATEQQAVDAKRRAWRSRIRWQWPLMPGMTITTLDGDPETLVCPEAIAHMGLWDTTWALERCVVHEAVHHAQTYASGGAVVPPATFQRNAPSPPRAVIELMEGHAQYVEILLTRQRLGEETWSSACNELRRVSTYTAVRARLMHVRNIASMTWHWARTAGAVPLHLPGERFSRDQPAVLLDRPQLTFIAHTIQAAGTDTWNKVWTNLDLVPTPDEINDPATWLKRVGLGL